ncbi:hypothetical protein Hanom_Chr12g01178301 [Helianthus anomalus]
MQITNRNKRFSARTTTQTAVAQVRAILVKPLSLHDLGPPNTRWPAPPHLGSHNKLPWRIISSLPILKLLKEPIEQMFENFRGEEGQEKSNDESGESKTPKIEEITIPSVTEMAKAGFLFSPVNGGISDISFDVKTCTLYLPVVELDVNTEVYLRNLVAYEACIAAGPLVMARYAELMNGIIDTEEDAKYLRERGIVFIGNQR